MKFVKRISLFFIYPMSMFALGFASNMAIDEFFYPGQNNEQISAPALTGAKAAPSAAIEVSYEEEPVITADTAYIIREYNARTGEANDEDNSILPDKYIGMTREMLSSELQEYSRNPSLTDIEQGFEYLELLSFSPQKVVVRKTFEPKEEEHGYFLINENHYVTVYDQSLKHLYMNTNILTDELPEALKNEIMQMKFVQNEEELYNFLESYSS